MDLSADKGATKYKTISIDGIQRSPETTWQSCPLPVGGAETCKKRCQNFCCSFMRIIANPDEPSEGFFREARRYLNS